MTGSSFSVAPEYVSSRHLPPSDLVEGLPLPAGRLGLRPADDALDLPEVLAALRHRCVRGSVRIRKAADVRLTRAKRGQKADRESESVAKISLFGDERDNRNRSKSHISQIPDLQNKSCRYTF